jgi:primosomal protein N' (replication factor Y) (superfamily II helicase)
MPCMEFIKVLVGDSTYHGSEALTYSHLARLDVGSLVRVPVKNKEVLGIVVSSASKPKFKVKPVIEACKLPPLSDNTLSLVFWLQSYYPAPLGILTQLILPKSLPATPLPIEALPPPTIKALPPPTDDQQKAIQGIKGPGMHLLHGETGSGKTRVYIELALSSVARGRSVVILTPEIGLTSQLAADFMEVFGSRVTIVHSKLTDATRNRIWQSALEQPAPLILIGPRSALFYPLKDIGLIVVDESHETAYKQDQAPYYHAASVAAKLAGIHQATLVLGSATPLVSDYYVTVAKKRPIIRMTQTASQTTADQPEVSIIDLRDKAQFGRSPYLSDTLIDAVKRSIQQKEQALLFLNRRGTARVIFCEQCGWQAACPHCDLPLVYHGDTHRMRCHSCNFSAPSVTSCPECRHTAIVFKTIGTKAIAAEVARLFPEASIMRFDTDNKKNERIEQHYQTIKSGNIDILVGTQTLAKGLDLPKLGTVGVIIADTSLYFPDFSAKERTYQLLVQVLGRVGRGHRASQIVVQSYMPDNPLLQSVINKDWSTFYNDELTERQTFLFPPFCYILKLSCKRASSQAAAKNAEALALQLRSRKLPIVIEGPAPSFHEKIQNKFAWQLIIKTKQRACLVQIIQLLPRGWSYDIDPMNLL